MTKDSASKTTSGFLISHRRVVIRIHRRPYSGNTCETATSIHTRLDGAIWNRASRCGRLALVCSAATDVHIEQLLVESNVWMGSDWACCVLLPQDVHIERMLVKSSV